MNFREYVNEGKVKQSFAGYNFEWDGKVITMFSKDGKELDTKDAPSLTSAKMKMMIADLNENLDEAKIDIEKVYSYVDYSKGDTDVDGVNYRDIKKAKRLGSVPEGTMFYAINKAGKKVSVRQNNNTNADIIKLDGKEYFVTFDMSFSGKKTTSEPMFALV